MTGSPFIVWDKKFEIGVGSVDTEHRVLFLAYNTFIKARIRGGSDLSTQYAISFLESYLSYHFRNEEALMGEIGYDRFQEHVGGHQRLLGEFSRMKAALGEGRDVHAEILVLFRDWLVNHVMEADRDIGVFLKCKDRFRAGVGAQRSSERPAEQTVALASPSTGGGAGVCITGLDGRVSRRYAVNIPGFVINHHGDEAPVIVDNLSQDGARLTGKAGLFREAAGLLRLPATTLPDLPFIVVSIKGEQSSVRFTLPSGKHLLLAKELMLPAFRASCLGLTSDTGDAPRAEGDIPVDGGGASLSGDIAIADMG